jgi:hypothetical protein
MSSQMRMMTSKWLTPLMFPSTFDRIYTVHLEKVKIEQKFLTQQISYLICLANTKYKQNLIKAD